jgi:apolipoprotein N-acyltransferase
MPWLAPLALGGLFASWMTLTPRAAAAAGYLAGIVFFALDFSWFGESAGALLGHFAFLLDVGPALVEGVAFAACAVATAVAARRLHGVAVAIIAAAAFTLTELLRSSGALGAPLYQIGAAFVDTPLAPLAAFGGVYTLTFVVALAAAVLAASMYEPNRRQAALGIAATSLLISALTTVAWWAWPARQPSPPSVRVAAVQGDIRQSVKWDPVSLPRAVDRYLELTSTLDSFHPQIVVWPETVVTTDLVIDPVLAAVPANATLVDQSTTLRRRFEGLARRLDTTLVVGSIEATTAGPYNDLFVFTPTGSTDGTPASTYRKHQLVPFAEFLPGPAWLRALPFADLVSNFGAGTQPAPVLTHWRIAPLICWEAGFTDLAAAQAAAGADFFAVATDDAWFGDSDGPYAQAQLAQLRAIETGRWIVRAAATGISGIIAPDGSWRERTSLDTATVVTGSIGAAQPTFYARLGPWPVGAAIALVAFAAAVLGRRRRI